MDYESWRQKSTLAYVTGYEQVRIELTPEQGILPIFQWALQNGASDIHLKNNLEPTVRLHGELKKLAQTKLTADMLEFMAQQVIPVERSVQYEEEGELDFTFTLGSGHRFRMSVYKENGVATLAARTIALDIPTLEQLKLPQVLHQFLALKSGLVLVTGPTGSGKSSTLAAMIHHINQLMDRHIITLEDPVEFLHPHERSIISQREVGRDTKSFATGLKAALRQDPDILLVGEMRDLETIQIALTAAETGHLVFATLHTSSAASTIDRIIDVFPANQQTQIRTQLANCIKGIVSQRLFKRRDGEGRVAAVEILVVNSSIANLIRTEKVHQIPTFIQTGKAEGMQLMEDEIKRLGVEG